MTLLDEAPTGVTLSRDEPPEPARGLYYWLTSTDHKSIGKSYLYTSLAFFFVAGGLAMLIRTQLIVPDNGFVSQQTYNELFTLHGSLMMFLFAGPFAFGGFANLLTPLQIGAPDMAFPRLNLLSYWLYLSGGLIMLSGFLVRGGAASFGWVAYAPLSNVTNFYFLPVIRSERPTWDFHHGEPDQTPAQRQ